MSVLTCPVVSPIARMGRPRSTEDPAQQANHIRCLMYRIYDELTVKEVSKRMGISMPTVKRWTKLALSYHGYPEIRKIRAAMKTMK